MMRFMKTAALLTALIGTLTAVTGCGGSGGGSGNPGYYGALYGGTSFYSENVINTGNRVVGGVVEPYGATSNYGGIATFCSTFNNIVGNPYGVYSCYGFSNPTFTDLTAIVPSGVQIPGGVGFDVFEANSSYIPGAVLRVVTQAIGNGRSRAWGSVVIPQQFMDAKRNAFPSYAASVRGFAFDLSVNSYNRRADGVYVVNGGLLVYTNGSNGVGGAFMKMVNDSGTMPTYPAY